MSSSVPLRALPRPRPPPLVSPDDDFFAGVDERVEPAPLLPPTPQAAPEVPAGPAPYYNVDFGMDATTVLGPPSIHTARGWAYRADKVLAPRGKTLRDSDGRMMFTRADFLRVSKDVLHTLAAYGLQVDASRVPWGAFRDEEDQFDREANWERLQSWLEER